MFEAVIYFAGPLSVWADVPDEREFIARFVSKWRSVAEARAQVCHTMLNERCGYFVRHVDDPKTFLVHVAATSLGPLQPVS